MVTIANKARHIGLHHHLLLSHGEGIDGGSIEVAVVYEALELPRGHRLGQTEADGDVALGIGLQGGIEEGGLVEVLAQRGPLGLLLCLGGRRLGHRRIRRQFVLDHIGTGRLGAGYSPHKELPACRCRTGIHGACGAIEEPAGPRRKLRERQVGLCQHLGLKITVQTDTSAVGYAPVGIVEPAYAILVVETPVMGINGIERMVVERGYELGVGGLAVGAGHVEGPRFLLSGHEAVAEGGPACHKPLVGHRPHDALGVYVAAAVLDPSIGEGEGVAIVIAVGEVAQMELALEVERAALYHAVVGKEAVDDVLFGGRRAQLQPYLVLALEAGAAQIEPVGGIDGGTGVGGAEEYKRVYEGVAVAHGGEHMAAALQPLEEGS